MARFGAAQARSAVGHDSSLAWEGAQLRRTDAGPKTPDLLLPAVVGISTDEGSDWARFDSQMAPLCVKTRRVARF